MMTRRIIGLVLTLCLMLSVCLIPAAAENGGSVALIYSTEDFYAAFPAEDGVVTVPSQMMVTVFAEQLTIEETVVVGENTMFILMNDCEMMIGGDLENNGSFTVCPGATLSLGGALQNNGAFSAMEKSLFIPMGGLVNRFSVVLDGIYGCGVFGASDGEPQRLSFVMGDNIQSPQTDPQISCTQGSVILINADEEHPADLGAAADDLRALTSEDAQGGLRGFRNADIYGYAHDLSEMIEMNEDDRLDGIYVEGADDRELIPIGEDLTIEKKLCVGPCDLVLQNGKTLTITDPQENLLFRENGRIVCEARGAAYPDAPAGGTLVLGGDPVFSGDPEAAPIHPTQDIIRLESGGDENGRYPAAGDRICIGDMSGAELHGSNGALDGLTVVMDGRDARVRLTDDFRCAQIRVDGELDLNGKTLNAADIYYTNGSRVAENGGAVTALPNYEIIVEAGQSGHYEALGCPAGTQVYPGAQMNVPMARIMQDPSFEGWRFDSGREIPQEELSELELVQNTDSGSDRYGEYYFVMPAYPVILRATWETQRVELTQYGTTVAFDGIAGHDYSMAYLDTADSADEEFTAFGTDKESVARIADSAAQMAGGDILNFIALWIYDGEEEIDTPFEMRVALPEGAADYDMILLRVVHIDGEDVHVDPMTVFCRVENGVLIAELERNESAFIAVGTDEQELNSVELELVRPEPGSSTDTPGTPDGTDWERNRQSNMPRVQGIHGPGAYVQGSLWILPGEGDIPFIGTFEEDEEYTFTVTVNAEPGYYFADDVQIVIRGAEIIARDAHIRDENGKADILYITAVMKPQQRVILGDADGNGRVTILDATAIQRRLASLPNESYLEAAADADGNGRVTILDATAIQRWLASLEKTLPIGEPMTV